jgi:hypothetical protein
VKKIRLLYHKITHWEYWPFDIVYIPVYLFWFALAIRARSLFFGTASNPGIENGGFLMESKKKIYDILPEGSYPKTEFFLPGTSLSDIKTRLLQKNLSFPLMAKPDIGMKGLATVLLKNNDMLRDYSSRATFPYLIQEYIDLPLEAGIFYVRIPGEPKGSITGIVMKEFVVVKGDGISTIRRLIESNPRFHIQLSALESECGDSMNTVLPDGIKQMLLPYGNHARGSKFTDASGLICAELEKTVDDLCKQIPGFYFGRMDIRFRNTDDLMIGKHFSIIELNGAGSEPTHIYDPRHSIFTAWKIIIRHLILLFKASSLLMKQGHAPLSFKEGIDMLRANRRHVKNLSTFRMP